MTLWALGRSGLVLAGLLLVAVGIGDVIAGQRKIAQYEELVRSTSPRPAEDPAALFPTASEDQQRYELARAKLAFYQLLVTAGHLLASFGFVLFAIGVLIVRLRTLRPAPHSAVPN
jgi:hypothetical protein